MSAGQVTWNLNLEGKGKFDREVDDSKSKVSSLGEASKNTESVSSKAFDGMATALKRTALAAGAAATAVGVFSFNQFRDIQKNVAGIQALTANTAEAKKVLNDAIDFVQGKPFDRLDTIGASKQLLSMGRSANVLKDDLRVLGNAVLLTGQPWEQLARIYGKVSSSNRLMNDDILILEQSLPIVDKLGKRMGATNEQVRKLASEGKVDFAIFKQALEDSAPDSAVQNSLKNFDNTWLSLKSSLRDVGFAVLGVDFKRLDENGRPLVTPGGLLDRLQNGMVALTGFLRGDFKNGMAEVVPQLKQWGENILKVTNAIGNYLGPKLENLFNTISTKVMPVLTRLWKEVIVPLAPMIGTVLVVALGLAIDAFNLLLAIVVPVTNWMLDNKPVVIGLAVAFGVLQAALNFSAGVAAFQGAMAAIRLSALSTFAVITAPIALPALAIAAVMGSLATVLAKAFETIAAFDALNRTIDQNSKSTDMAIARAQQQLKDARARGDAAGVARNQRALESIAGQRASGGPVSAGKQYLVGEQGPELFVPNSSGEIIPNGQGGGSTIENHIGVINIASEVDAQRLLRKLTRDQEVIDTGLIPSMGAM